MGHPGRGRLNSRGPCDPGGGIYPDGAGGMAFDLLCMVHSMGRAI